MTHFKPSPMEIIGRGLDRFVGLFSPASEYRRSRIREINQVAWKKAGRSSDQYAAAKTNRLTGPWTGSDADINRIIGLSSPAVRRRVRQLVRDFPYFYRAKRTITDYVVGDGIVFQSKIRRPDGKLDKKVNQAVEDAFSWWADEADVARKLHFYEMMQLAKNQDSECGEFILVKRWRPNDGRFLPYCLQMYEPDLLTTQYDRGYGPANAYTLQPNGPDVDIYQGIEYNRYTGEVLAYHFMDPDGWGKAIRVPAKDVIHGFETLRPGQLRGISPFTPAVMVTHDLSEYMDAEIDAAKMASKYLGSIKTTNPYGMAQAGWSSETDSAGKERTLEEMENAILKVLLPGEEMELTSNPRPSQNFPPMVRLILGMISVTTGAPYELLSADYQGLSWSTAKIIRTDFAHALRPLHTRHIRHFCRPSARPFLDYAVAYGKLSMPGYFSRPGQYIKDQWQPPGVESIDLLRETKAVNDQISVGLRSPQEHAASRGRDLEDIYKEILAARELAEEMGLSFSTEKTPDPSTSLNNNPAAVEKQK